MRKGRTRSKLVKVAGRTFKAVKALHLMPVRARKKGRGHRSLRTAMASHGCHAVVHHVHKRKSR